MYKKVFPALKLSIYISVLLFLLSCGEKNDPLIQKANQEWIQGHNHSALELLNEVLKNNPRGQKAEEALFRMGEIHHFSLNNSIRALVFFQEEFATPPKLDDNSVFYNIWKQFGIGILLWKTRLCGN